MTTRRAHEGPHGDSPPGGTRLPLRAAARQPSSFRRGSRRPDALRHRRREGRRRGFETYPARDSSSVRLAVRRVPLGGCRNLRLEYEPARPAFLSVREAKGRQQRHLEAYVPWRTPSQKLSLLGRRQLGDSFEIQFYADQQRRPSVLKRRPVGGDVEIGTDRVPQASVLARITAQSKGHVDILLARLKHTMRYWEGTMSAVHVSAIRGIRGDEQGRQRWRMA